MGRPKKNAVAVEESLIPGAELEPVPDTADGERAAILNEPAEPEYGQPGWSKYLLGKLTPAEYEVSDNAKLPNVAGLRRLVATFLGPIVSSVARVEKVWPGYAAVSHEVQIDFDQDNRSGVRVFAEVADVNDSNCDKAFARFAVATASTRAESRALRKALQLTVVAAEETTTVPVEESDGLITRTQITFLDRLCERNKINVLKYINSGTKQYGRIEDVSVETAQKMMKFLSDCQQDQSTINPAWLGYDANWRGNQK